MTEERGNIGFKCCVASNEGQDPLYIYMEIGFDDK